MSSVASTFVVVLLRSSCVLWGVLVLSPAACRSVYLTVTFTSMTGKPAFVVWDLCGWGVHIPVGDSASQGCVAMLWYVLLLLEASLLALLGCGAGQHSWFLPAQARLDSPWEVWEGCDVLKSCCRFPQFCLTTGWWGGSSLLARSWLCSCHWSGGSSFSWEGVKLVHSWKDCVAGFPLSSA